MTEDRSNWEFWQSRLSKEESNELLRLSHILKEKGKIKRCEKYAITRFALRSLLITLTKQPYFKTTEVNPT